MNKLAIFVSGSGTNMENIIRKVQAGKIPAQVALVLSDNPSAGAIEKAKRLSIETVVVPRKQFGSKSEFEAEISRHVDEKKIDLIALAGFMRILSSDFVNRYLGRIVNIHPASLPAFPGAHAIRDTFEAKVKETAVTTHFVTADVDAGQIILQRKIKVDFQGTLESLEMKIHATEYGLYPETLCLVLSGKVKFDKRK